MTYQSPEIKNIKDKVDTHEVILHGEKGDAGLVVDNGIAKDFIKTSRSYRILIISLAVGVLSAVGSAIWLVSSMNTKIDTATKQIETTVSDNREMRNSIISIIYKFDQSKH